jgi:hypothetical protein
LPILYAVIEGLKHIPAWFSALIAMNLRTAYQPPPVAMSAYCLKAVIPRRQPPSLLVLTDQVADLIYREKSIGLSPAEKSELDHYLQLEQLMRLAKARDHQHISNAELHSGRTSASGEPPHGVSLRVLLDIRRGYVL